jgi:predicted TIM-barrel fold metal-dependent hydrolase
MKARHSDRFFVFAGLNHAEKLSAGRVRAPGLAEQVEGFVGMGCDGIKMIEGKPTSRQRMDVPVTDPYFAEYWACVEELGMPIVWHVNDPEEFWDPEKIPGWARERNWGYGPHDVQKEQLYAEVDEVLPDIPA